MRKIFFKLCVLLRKSELYKGKSAHRRHLQYLRLINLVCELRIIFFFSYGYGLGGYYGGYAGYYGGWGGYGYYGLGHGYYGGVGCRNGYGAAVPCALGK